MGCYFHKEEKPTKLWLDEDGLVSFLAFSVWKGTRTKKTGLNRFKYVYFPAQAQ